MEILEYVGLLWGLYLCFSSLIYVLFPKLKFGFLKAIQSRNGVLIHGIFAILLGIISIYFVFDFTTSFSSVISILGILTLCHGIITSLFPEAILVAVDWSSNPFFYFFVLALFSTGAFLVYNALHFIM